jgi:hypothetical protein
VFDAELNSLSNGASFEDFTRAYTTVLLKILDFSPVFPGIPCPDSLDDLCLFCDCLCSMQN